MLSKSLEKFQEVEGKILDMTTVFAGKLEGESWPELKQSLVDSSLNNKGEEGSSVIIPKVVECFADLIIPDNNVQLVSCSHLLPQEVEHIEEEQYVRIQIEDEDDEDDNSSIGTAEGTKRIPIEIVYEKVSNIQTLAD